MTGGPVESESGQASEPPRGVAMFAYRAVRTVRTSAPYLTVLGIAAWLTVWWLFSEVWLLPRFDKMPGPVAVLSDLFAREPFQGISIFTAEYYEHIWVSCRRILFAFCIATGIGVPLGLLMGWSVPFRHFTLPILETLRPIPILAWVPLSILMFPGFEAPVIFLATLASLFVTTLNTMLGVQSIDESYFRAAGCLGSSKWQIFRHVVVPGALPFVFTRLADQHRGGVVLPRRGGDGVGRLGSRLPHRRCVHEQRDGADGDRHGHPPDSSGGARRSSCASRATG